MPGARLRLNLRKTISGAARRQYRRPEFDLRIDRLRLRTDLSGQPRAQSRAWRIDDGRLVSTFDHGLDLHVIALHRDRGRDLSQPHRRRDGQQDAGTPLVTHHPGWKLRPGIISELPDAPRVAERPDPLLCDIGDQARPDLHGASSDLEALLLQGYAEPVNDDHAAAYRLTAKGLEFVANRTLAEAQPASPAFHSNVVRVRRRETLLRRRALRTSDAAY